MPKKQKKAEIQEDFPVPCAFIGCPDKALVKIRVMANAWSNYCARHYLEYHQRKAEEVCEALGLKTTEQQRKWVGEAMRKLSEKMRA